MLQLVQVRWNDAWTDATEPVTVAEAKVDHEPKVIVTLGYLLYENEKGVKVANEYYEEEDIYRGQTFIPRGMVIDVTPFNLTRPRKRAKGQPEDQGREHL